MPKRTTKSGKVRRLTCRRPGRFYELKAEDPYVRITPMSAIYLKCLDCSGGSPKGVDECGDVLCPLWDYRLGRLDSAERSPGPLSRDQRADLFRGRCSNPEADSAPALSGID